VPEAIELSSYQIKPSGYKSFVIEDEKILGCFCQEGYWGLADQLELGFTETVNGNEICVETQVSGPHGCIIEDLSEYRWDWGDGTIEIVTSQPYSACHTYTDDPSNYEITFSAEIHTWSILCETVVIKGDGTVSTKELGQFGNMHLYPNPTTGKLFVDFGESLNSELDIELISILGHKVLSTQVLNGARNFMLDSSVIDKGLYFVVFKRNGIVIAQKKMIKI